MHGDVFAMAGGTPEHARLAMSFGRELGNALIGRPCAVFSADARIRIAAIDVATYPDLSVVCRRIEPGLDDRHAIANPLVIVEVPSDATEAFERGEKFRRYRRLPSLREYVLVSQHEPRLEVFRRDEDGSWRFEEVGPGERLRLASIDVLVDVDAVFRDPLAAG